MIKEIIPVLFERFKTSKPEFGIYIRFEDQSFIIDKNGDKVTRIFKYSETSPISINLENLVQP